MKDHKILMLHRTKKEQDVNAGKWIGVGGKFEAGESIEDCIKREVKEETGYTLFDMKVRAYVVFPGLHHGEDEGMFMVTSDAFTGTMKECNEGDLAWIDEDKISELNMWAGDYHFLEWLKDDKFHSAKLVYDGDTIITYEHNAY